MTVLGATELIGETLEEARDFLLVSGVVDDHFYRQAAGIESREDAALHYLREGWRANLRPNPAFDGEFLAPYYASAGYSGPPALSWADLASLGGASPPTNAADAETFAAEVRDIPIFDNDSYRERLAPGLDPATHYVLVGERLGWRPSKGFDPAFYAECNPDIIEAGGQPLRHFWFHGMAEGRSSFPAADRLDFPPLPAGDGRPVVLFVSHEASRTGAPILGWNIVRKLAPRYRVVSLLMNGGALESAFAEEATVQVGPMRRTEWLPAHARGMAERLAKHYRPLFAITNSIETHVMVPALAREGVATVSLVHEFPSYTHDVDEKMANVFNWSPSVIFPAQIVAEAAFERFHALRYRSGVTVLAQGRSDLPPTEPKSADEETRLEGPGPIGVLAEPDAFVVLGLGTIEMRKGIDLFVSCASAVKRLRPDLPIRFVWLGAATEDFQFNSFFADQLARSDLGDTVSILDPVEDLAPFYDRADLFFMSSRLDPQPNVGIDALARGIPTICFQSACGTGEILAADADTAHLVVPYLDVHTAAERIVELASDPAECARLGEAVARVGARSFDMARYVDAIETMGREAAHESKASDVLSVRDSELVDPDFAIPFRSAPLPPDELAVHATRRWTLWNLVGHPQVASPLRRPFAGFHPQAYAKANPEILSSPTRDPIAHWLEAGRPDGAWSHRVYTPLDPPRGSDQPSTLRIALHGHFYYTDLADDLAWRLSLNRSACDLFLTTRGPEQAAALRHSFVHHRGRVDVRVVPNRGRDIGPFLTELGSKIAALGYDVVGHVHGKKTLVVAGTTGDDWRRFLWENLVGGRHRMLDLCAAVFANDPECGLLFPDDPHLAGWDKNRSFADRLAERMGLALPLDDFFDFPVGTMFWARPKALGPLFDLGLGWDDYPEEPVPYDGTVLHALERLMPFAAKHTGHTIAGVHVPGTSW